MTKNEDARGECKKSTILVEHEQENDDARRECTIKKDDACQE